MRVRTWIGIITGFLRENLFSLGLFLGIFGILLMGIQSAQSESRLESLRIVEESVQRGIVTCYAIEGRYPDSISYLEQNYNLILDESKYYIQYEIFASNIMPQITVIEVGA